MNVRSFSYELPGKVKPRKPTALNKEDPIIRNCNRSRVPSLARPIAARHECVQECACGIEEPNERRHDIQSHDESTIGAQLGVDNVCERLGFGLRLDLQAHVDTRRKKTFDISCRIEPIDRTTGVVGIVSATQKADYQNPSTQFLLQRHIMSRIREEFGQAGRSAGLR